MAVNLNFQMSNFCSGSSHMTITGTLSGLGADKVVAQRGDVSTVNDPPTEDEKEIFMKLAFKILAQQTSGTPANRRQHIEATNINLTLA